MQVVDIGIAVCCGIAALVVIVGLYLVVKNIAKGDAKECEAQEELMGKALTTETSYPEEVTTCLRTRIAHLTHDIDTMEEVLVRLQGYHAVILRGIQLVAMRERDVLTMYLAKLQKGENQ